MIVNLICSLLIGALCGWLAGQIMHNNGSFLRNVILGIIGGFVGGIIFNLLGFSINGIVGSIISGVVGSCLVIFVAKKLFK